METDLSVNKQSFGDTFLSGVRQHLEAVGRGLEVCEMLEIGEKMQFDFCGTVGASLVRKGGGEDLVQPESTSDSSARQFTLLLPAFSNHEQRIIPSSVPANFPYQLPRPESSGLKVCQCMTCGEQFSNYGLYALHRCMPRQQAPPVKCTACDRRFSRSSDLLRHSCQQPTSDSYHGRFSDRKYLDLDRPKRIKSEQLSLYSCNQCHKQFRSNSHLTRHLQVHTGERRHQCGVCEKWFSEPSSVKRHMYIHTNEAPHACPTCGHRYSSPCYLREHMLSHTGERPNKCPVCDKQYSRSGHLTRHLRQHARCQERTVAEDPGGQSRLHNEAGNGQITCKPSTVD